MASGLQTDLFRRVGRTKPGLRDASRMESKVNEILIRNGRLTFLYNKK